jgi:hypothetical protein
LIHNAGRSPLGGARKDDQMKTQPHISTRFLAAGSALMLAAAVLVGGLAASAAGPTTVPLGTASSFAVLAGSGITNTGSTVVNGDIGSFPTTTISGFPPGLVNGTNHGGDAVTQGAKNDLVTAYSNAAGKTPVTTVPTELAGSTLTGGTYSAASGTFGLTGNLTLNGGGDSTSVWVFQMASTLTTATGSSVTLIGGAQSCNVFWQVGSSATLGGSTTFRGNILALTSITLVTGATIDGRALARNGAVTLDTNTITPSTCAAAPTPTPAATAIPTATATPVPTATPAPTTSTPAPVVAPIATAAPQAPKSLPSTSTQDLESVPTWILMLSIALLTSLAISVRVRRPRGHTPPNR